MQDPTVTIEELAISNTYQLEAIVRVLVKKGIVTKQELIDEVMTVKVEHEEKIKKGPKA